MKSLNLKIAIVGPLRPGKISGPAFSLVALARSLESQGAEIGLYSTLARKGQSFSFNGYKIQSYNFYREYSGYDICILSVCFDIRLLPLSFVLKLKKIPYVVSPRGGLMRSAIRKSPIKKILSLPLVYLILLRNALAIHYLSVEEHQNSLFPKLRNIVVSNAIDFRELGEQSVPNGVRRKIIGYIGRYDIHQKGLDLLVKAVAQTASELRGSGYKIVLHGSDYRGGKKILSRLIKRLSIGDLVQINDAIFEEEKAKFLEKIQFFVHCSRYEGQPQAVVEAIYHGCTVLISPECNMHSLLEKFNTGHVVERSSLQECLARISSNNMLQNGINCRSKFRNEFAYEMIGNEMIHNISALLRFGSK